LGISVLAVVAAFGPATAAQGALLHSFDKYFGSGMATPEALAVDQSNGDIYVLEHGNGCVARFYGTRGTPNDLEPKTFPATGTNKVCGISFRNETSTAQIAIDNSGTATEGSFYVNAFVDENSNVGVQEFDNEGNLKGNIPPRRLGDSLVYQCGVTTDKEGNVYVAEHYSGFFKYKRNDPVTDADFEDGPYVGPICAIAIDSKVPPASGEPWFEGYNWYFNFNNTGPLRRSEPEFRFGFSLQEPALALSLDRETDDIYVSDGGQVNGYSWEGIYFSSFGRGVVTEARGVAIDSLTGTAYVSDSTMGRLAVFDGSPAYRIGVEPQGTGFGSVDADSPPIEGCGDEGPCAGFYVPGNVVLEATPQPHSIIDGWTGCDSVNVAGDECTVNLGADREVLANFTRLQQPLTVDVAGTGTGSVSTPNKLGAIQGCGDGGPCTGPYDEGSVVTLIPTPTGHSSFTGWSGACTNDTGPCEVVMEAAESVTAHFTSQHPVRVSKDGSGAGSVLSSPDGISCGGTCLFYFTDGDDVTLTASPAAHSTFAGWSGEGCSGTGTCEVTAGVSTKQVFATFDHDPPTTLTEAGATFVGQRAGTVHGQVNPEGAQVSRCVFEYGTTTAYGNEATCAPSAVGGGTTQVEVGANLSGLEPGTVYHYRLSATNSGGTVGGGDQSFRTLDDTCDSNAALCPPPRTSSPPEPTCKRGFVLKKGKCVKKKTKKKKKKRKSKNRHGRGGAR
jgi:hypothetical protein